MVVMDQFSRRIVGFAVHAGTLDGPTICRMFNRIVSGCGTPRYLSSDNDPLFQFHQWQAKLRILDVTEVKTVPYVPLSHPLVERLIGTVRREYLDQVPFWSARDLERKLSSYQDYYNKGRVHRGLDGAPSNEQGELTDRKIAHLDDYRWEKYCRGLYQLPVAGRARYCLQEIKRISIPLDGTGGSHSSKQYVGRHAGRHFNSISRILHS